MVGRRLITRSEQERQPLALGAVVLAVGAVGSALAGLIDDALRGRGIAVTAVGRAGDGPFPGGRAGCTSAPLALSNAAASLGGGYDVAQ